MSIQPDHYDADYYRAGCGPIPYQDRAAWLARFRDVAALLIAAVQPKTAYDAGCAFGYLVEALRERGVDARGVDISDYAISQAVPDVRPYVRVGSVTEPLPDRVDLITCIEILEHVDAATGDAAIANFCAHADAVLFSSSPDDDDTDSHINIQPPHYWAERFARHGFTRDLSADVTLVAPWAALFRKGGAPDWRDYEDAHVAAAGRIAQLERDLTRARAAEAQLRASEVERARLADLLRGYENGRVMRALNALRRLGGGRS
jgi:SAM-dependent methyltransferase